MVERVPFRQLLGELVELLRPTAERLGTSESLDDVVAIAEHGSGTDRQRAVLAAGGTLHDVVNHLVEEFASDNPSIR
jgi:carboxylate-amine ligase